MYVPLDILGYCRHRSLHHPRPVNITHCRSLRTVRVYVKISVVDPVLYPNWIRILWGPWIRFQYLSRWQQKISAFFAYPGISYWGYINIILQR